MKAKCALLVLFLAVALNSNAQGKTPPCESSFNTFEQNVKAGDFRDEQNLLPDLIKLCPKFNEKIYIYGQAVLEYKIDAARTPEEKKKLVTSLLELYTKYDLNFPASTNANDIKKAMLQNKHKLATDAEVYKLLNAAFIKNKQAYTNYEALELYYNLFLKEYEAGKGLTQDEFIETYGNVSGQVITAKGSISEKKSELLLKQETTPLTDDERFFLKGADQSLESLGAVGDNINKQSSKHLSCQKLEVFYNKNYEANKTSALWLEGMVNVMMDNRCYNSPIMQQGALQQHTIQPTTKSAYTLGTIALRNRKPKDAIAYFDESATLEKSLEKKADLYYEIATVFRNSDKAEAKKYILKAAELNPKSGKPYILLAEMYSSVTKECTLTDIEKKALYWLAIDAANKAGAAEKKYQPTAVAMIKQFDAKKPSKEDLKGAKLKKGAKLTIGCWINETVTIPSL